MINKVTVTILIILSFFCLAAESTKRCTFETCNNVEEECKKRGYNKLTCQTKQDLCGQDLTTKDGEIAKLKGQIKTKESEIASLKKSAGKDASKSVTLEQEIKTKDGEIAKLKEQITAKESEIANLKSAVGQAKKDSKGEISERNSQIETLEGEKTALQGELDAAKKQIEELKKKVPEESAKDAKDGKPEGEPNGIGRILLALLFGFLLGCAVLILIYMKFNSQKHKNYRSADEENEEPNSNSSDIIAEKVAGKLSQTLGRITMIVNSLPKQVSEQVVTQLMPIIRQQIEKSNVAATTHHTEAVSIPAEPVIKTYYARMVGERFESSGERSAWFILKDDGNTITFDLVDSCKKDRRTMNEAFKVLSQCFENYDSSDSNAVLITSPGKARRDDEEHWRVFEKGRIIR